MPAPYDDAPGAANAEGTRETTNDLDFATGQRPDKDFVNVAVDAAFLRCCLWRSDRADGPPSYFLEHLGLVQRLSSLEGVKKILAKIGGHS